MDRNTGRGPPERNRQTKETMAVQGAQEAMAGGHSWPWPRPGHSSRNPSTLPPQISLGKLGGIRSPPGLDTQNSTRQDRKGPPGPDRQDMTAHRNQKPSWAGLEAEASSGHDQESEAHTGSLSDRLHFSDKGAGS